MGNIQQRFKLLGLYIFTATYSISIRSTFQLRMLQKLLFLYTDDQAEEIKLLKCKLQECIGRIEALEAAVLLNHNSYVMENSTYNNEWMYFTPTSDVGTSYSPPTINSSNVPNQNAQIATCDPTTSSTSDACTPPTDAQPQPLPLGKKLKNVELNQIPLDQRGWKKYYRNAGISYHLVWQAQLLNNLSDLPSSATN